MSGATSPGPTARWVCRPCSPLPRNQATVCIGASTVRLESVHAWRGLARGRPNGSPADPCLGAIPRKGGGGGREPRTGRCSHGLCCQYGGKGVVATVAAARPYANRSDECAVAGSHTRRRLGASQGGSAASVGRAGRGRPAQHRPLLQSRRAVRATRADHGRGDAQQRPCRCAHERVARTSWWTLTHAPCPFVAVLHLRRVGRVRRLSPVSGPDGPPPRLDRLSGRPRRRR